MGRHAADARDTCLAGTPDQIRDKLDQLRAARVDTVFVPTMFRPVDELRRDLDRFIAEIAHRVPVTDAGAAPRTEPDGLEAMAPDAIGITLPHEHLLIDFKGDVREPAAAADKARARRAG
jgi:hypothetical protein